jgi:hypothetical protein
MLRLITVSLYLGSVLSLPYADNSVYGDLHDETNLGQSCSQSLGCTEDTDRKLKQLGESCGDEHSICAKGLFCHKPNRFGVVGACANIAKHRSQEGQQCNGPEGVKCAPGLNCLDEGSIFMDQYGVCVNHNGHNDVSIQLNASTPKLSTLNENCGGKTNLKCAKGLFCKRKNRFAGSTGTCQDIQLHSSSVNEACGGIENLKCARGLTCSHRINIYMDGFGTCIKDVSEEVHTMDAEQTLVQSDNSEALNPAALGHACGGDSNLKCAKGSFCKKSSRFLITSSGICHDVRLHFALAGEACGGEERIRCANGLSCSNEPNIFMDGFSTCV